MEAATMAALFVSAQTASAETFAI
jgi:hypothetical protein